MNNNLMVIESSNVLTMSSLEIAELTGKRHDNVVRDIKAMFEQLDDSDGLLRSEDTYLNPQNGQKYKCYHLPKRDTLCLIAGYNVQVRMRIIDRWQELEEKQTQATPKTYIEALEKLLESEKEKLVLKEELKAAEPKVEFVDSFVDSTGLKSFRKLAKILGINERKFRQFLVENKIMYKQNGDWLPYAEHINAGRFVNKTGEYQGRAFISTYFTPKGEVWIAGLLKEAGEIA